MYTEQNSENEGLRLQYTKMNRSALILSLLTSVVVFYSKFTLMQVRKLMVYSRCDDVTFVVSWQIVLILSRTSQNTLLWFWKSHLHEP